MSLKVGIVGLANVGKSTLFNALLKKQQAYVANFPFATIEPNIGIVPVPDERLNQLQSVVSSQSSVVPPIVPATIQFVDIAGLVAGAHKGEGLGNKFLSHIREADAICHVVRHFKDKDVIRTGTEPKEDFEIVKTELDLADYEMTENAKERNKGVVPDNVPLFSKKPILVVLNVDEEDLINAENIESEFATALGLSRDQIIAICAKTEAELAALDEEEQKQYLADLGLEQSGLERLTQKAFKTLGLITFLTAGEKSASAGASARQREVRAWTIRKGTIAVQASGVIHTDFMAKFIKAEIVKYEDFIAFNGWKGAREKGKARLEGKEYVMQDGDVVEFKIGT